MPIVLKLDEEQSQRLEQVASELNVDASELAKAAINDLVCRPTDDFARAVNYVLDKNRELYRRLA
jgi:predicted transcriptional regulator